MGLWNCLEAPDTPDRLSLRHQEARAAWWWIVELIEIAELIEILSCSLED
jgi:hypothetical protein